MTTNGPRLGKLTIQRTTAVKNTQDDLIQIFDENGAIIGKTYWTGKQQVSQGFDIIPSFGAVEFAFTDGAPNTTFQVWMVSPTSKHMFQLSQNFIEVRGLKIKEGSNQRMGVVTLVAGSVVVSNNVVTANSRIFLTTQSSGGTVGAPYVSARTPGTSFTITSTSGSDTSQVAYLINEPGIFLE